MKKLLNVLKELVVPGARLVAFLLAILSVKGALATTPTPTVVWRNNLGESYTVGGVKYAIAPNNGSLGSNGNITAANGYNLGATIDLSAISGLKNVSVLVKYSGLSLAASRDYGIAFAAIKDSSNFEAGAYVKAGSATDLYSWSQTASANNYTPSAISPTREILTGSGYMLFSYSATTGMRAYMGATIDDLTGGVSTYSCEDVNVTSLSIGGPAKQRAMDSSGMIIEEVALFVGQYLSNADVADFDFNMPIVTPPTPIAVFNGFSASIEKSGNYTLTRNNNTINDDGSISITKGIKLEASAGMSYNSSAGYTIAVKYSNMPASTSGAFVSTDLSAVSSYDNGIGLWHTSAGKTRGLWQNAEWTNANQTQFDFPNSGVAVYSVGYSDNPYKATAFDKNGNIIYYSGGLYTSTSSTGGQKIYVGSLCNGGNYNTSVLSNMKVEGVAVFNKRLSDSEISAFNSKVFSKIIAANATWSTITSANFNGDSLPTNDTWADVTINVTESATLTLDSNVAVGKITFNVLPNKTLTLSGSGSLAAANGVYVTGGGTLAKGSFASSSATTVSGDGTTVISTISPTANVSIGEGTTFELKDCKWSDSANCISGEGTLHLNTTSSYSFDGGTRIAHDVSGSSFAGTLKVSVPSGKAAYFNGNPEAQLTGRPSLILNCGTQGSMGALWVGGSAVNKYLKVKNLSGWANVIPWSNKKGNHYVETVQEDNTTFSGSFTDWMGSAAGTGGEYKMGLSVKGNGAVKSLTLSGVNITTGPLTIQDKGKVVFPTGGSWANGTVTVGNNGYLESTNGTAVTQLVLQNGATVAFPSTSGVLSGIESLTLPGSGSAMLDVSAITNSITWSGLALISTTGGIINSNTDISTLSVTSGYRLAAEADAIKVYPVLVAELKNMEGSSIAKYTSLQDAVDGIEDKFTTIVCVYEASTASTTETPLFIKPDGISLNDVTLNCPVAGRGYVKPDNDMTTYGYPGVYQVENQVAPATFTWNTSVASGNWSDVENWTSEDGEVTAAPNSPYYTIAFQSNATVNHNQNITAARINIGATVKIDGVNQSRFEINATSGGIVLTNDGAGLWTRFYDIAEGTSFSSAVPGKYVWHHSSSDWNIYDLANAGATVYDAEDNAVGSYTTLADAVAAASDGYKVTLFANSSETVAVSDKTITFSEGDYTFSGSFTGNGTVVLGAALKGAGTISWPEGWTGTVELKNITTAITDFDFAHYGNTGSTVRANNVKVSVPDTAGEYGNVKEINIVGNDGLIFSGDVRHNKEFTFSAALTGSGHLGVETPGGKNASGFNTSSTAAKFVFKGDISGFTGKVDFAACTSYRAIIVFADADDTIPTPTDWGEIIVTKDVTLTSNSTLAGEGGFIIEGEMRALGSGAAITTNGKKICGSGTIVLDADSLGVLGSGKFNSDNPSKWTGTVKLPALNASSGFDWKNYGVSGSKIELGGITGGYLNPDSPVAINAELVLNGAMNLTAFSQRAYSFAKVSGDGNMVLGTSSSPTSIGITVLTNYTGVVTNNTSVAVTIGTLALDAGAAVTPGTKLLSTGGTGAFSVTTVTVGGAAQSLTLAYESDGIYVALATATTSGEVTTNHGSLAFAAAAAGAGGTVTLLADSTEDITLSEGQRFDTNGNTYSGTPSATGTNIELAHSGNVYTAVDNSASTWNGNSGDAWGTDAKWSTGVKPNSYTAVTLPSTGSAYTIGVKSDDKCATITVNGDVTLNRATSGWKQLHINGDISGTGTLTLNMVGLMADSGEGVMVSCNFVSDGGSDNSFVGGKPFTFSAPVRITGNSGSYFKNESQAVTFNNTVTIEANAELRAYGASLTFNKPVSIAASAQLKTHNAAGTITLNDSVSVAEGGTLNPYGAAIKFGETFTLQVGKTLSASGGSVTLDDGELSGPGTAVMNSGIVFGGTGANDTLTVKTTVTSAADAEIGNGGTAALNIDNGGHVTVGSFGSSAADRKWVNFKTAEGGSTGNSININEGGVFEACVITIGVNSPCPASINFNGGTLTTYAGTSDSYDGAHKLVHDNRIAVNILAGGANIDIPSGKTSHINAVIANGVAEGTDGGLTKKGEGVLIVEGTPTYAGKTSVKAGALYLPSGYEPDLALDTVVTDSDKANYKKYVFAPAASFGGYDYATLQAAIDAAEEAEGGVVTLLRDCDDDATLVAGVTVNNGGFTYSGEINAVASVSVTTPSASTTYYATFDEAASAAGANVVTLLDDVTIDVDSGDTLTISSPIAGSFGITKTGAGTLVLNGAHNTYSGTTTVNAGVLQVSGIYAGAAPLYDSIGSYSIAADAKLKVDGAVITTSLTLSGTIEIANTVGGGYGATITTLTANSGSTIMMSSALASLMATTFNLPETGVVNVDVTNLGLTGTKNLFANSAITKSTLGKFTLVGAPSGYILDVDSTSNALRTYVPVAMIGDTPYETLLLAFNAANSSGDTITLVGDSSQNIYMPEKSVIFDEGDCTFTGTFSNPDEAYPTIELVAELKAADSSRWDANNWCGTVVLTNLTVNGLNINNYGTQYSTVRLAGITGWFSNAPVYSPTVELHGDVNITQCSQGHGNTFAKIKGVGDFDLSAAGFAVGSSYAYFLLKDVSGFTGSIKTKAGGAGIVLGGTTKPTGTDDLGKIIVNTAATIGAGETWVAPGGVRVSEGVVVTMGAEASISGTVTLKLGASVKVPSGTTAPTITTDVPAYTVTSTTADGVTTYTTVKKPGTIFSVY